MSAPPPPPPRAERLLVDLHDSVLSSSFCSPSRHLPLADAASAAPSSSSAVRPPPPMPSYVQAAIAAERENGTIRHETGYDTAVASMRTSWEIEAAEATAHAWKPATSAFASSTTPTSAVRSAPEQPALVTAALTERRRFSVHPAPTVSGDAPTSWEREAELLRHMHLSTGSDRHGSDRGDATPSRAHPGTLAPYPTLCLPCLLLSMCAAGPSSASSPPLESSGLEHLRRVVSELDSIWAR